MHFLLPRHTLLTFFLLFVSLTLNTRLGADEAREVRTRNEWSADSPPRVPTWSDPAAVAAEPLRVTGSPRRGVRPQKAYPATQPSLVAPAIHLASTGGSDMRIATVGYSSGPVDQSVASAHARCTNCDGGCAFGCNGPPLGASLDYYFGRQIYNGHRARQVLYRFDFGSYQGDATRLNIYGLRKLRRMVSLMEATGLPMIVESTPEQPALAAARRSYVLEVLRSRLETPVADTQVVVGVPPVPGLRADEAAEIYTRHMATTRAQGMFTSGFQSGRTNSGSPSTPTSPTTGTGISR